MKLNRLSTSHILRFHFRSVQDKQAVDAAQELPGGAERNSAAMRSQEIAVAQAEAASVRRG
jgi:hypothetical protein